MLLERVNFTSEHLFIWLFMCGMKIMARTIVETKNPA